MAPTSTWVSKTDLINYLRCPYAFYMIASGQVAREDTVSELQIRLIEQGVEFQTAVELKAVAESKAVPLAIVDTSDLRKVFAQESVRLCKLPLFKNPKLQILGVPDGIDTAQGALIPVETKSHKAVLQSDELELAFYWLLLEPYRTKTVSPRGRLLLRRNDIAEEVEIEIEPKRFEQVLRLLGKIRDARVHGVRPRICSCNVCNGIMRDKIRQTTSDNKDLSMIWDIGPIRARHLEEIGINSYEALLTVDCATVVAKLRERQCFVSQAHVNRWKQHATSYSNSRPVLFGDPPPLDESFIALDLEYVHGKLVWLAGVCLVTKNARRFFSYWADTPKQEEESLRSLIELVAANPTLAVVTWAGIGADLPQLKFAWTRLNLGEALNPIESRHLDLYQYATKSVRFPMPRLSLGELGSYFAIPKLSHISSGLQALSLYGEYRHSQDVEQRRRLKANLIQYNLDDLEALVGVAQGLVGLKRETNGVA
jgi:predicted RecB family nuclease